MKVKQVKEEDRLPWMSSLVEVPRDELPHLRGLLADGEDVRETKVEGKKKSRSSSSEKKKEKRKKKRKKEKKAERELRRKKESAEDGRRAKESSGGAPLLKGQKRLEDVFGGTGLDPSPTVRRRVKRKARESARKSAKKSSSSSSSSSDSSSLSGQSHEGLFPESRKVKGIANNLSTAPGEGNLSPDFLMREETMNSSTMFGRDSATLGTQAPTTEGAYLSGAATQRMESLLGGGGSGCLLPAHQWCCCRVLGRSHFCRGQ